MEDNIGTAHELVRILNDELTALGIQYSKGCYPYTALWLLLRRYHRLAKIDGVVYYSLIGARTTIRWWLNTHYRGDKNDS